MAWRDAKACDPATQTLGARRPTTRRVEACVRLLRDPAAAPLTVTQIAFAAGFADLATFHRQFRRRVGVPPRTLR
jgi:AraC-like DNA-binding protein